MNYLARNKSLFAILVLATIFGACTESFGFEVLGTREALETQEVLNGSSSRPATHRPVNRPSRRPSTTIRKNVKVDVSTGINDAYAKMVETINAHRSPSTDQMTANEAALRVPGSAMSYLDDKTQIKYYILKAWNEYFSDDLKTAQQVARTAFKKSLSNEDARITMTSIYLLAGENPVMSVPVNKRAPAKNNNTYRSYDTSSQGTNLLDLDVDGLNTDLTDPKDPEKILAMELNCLNSTTFKYTPGSESLCVIFWKLSEKDTASIASSEPNDPSAKPVAARKPQPKYNNGYEDEYAMQSGYNPYGSGAKGQNPTFMSNTKAFKEMFSEAFGMDNVKFLAVNTDTLAAKQMVVEKLMEYPWPWANVMAHDPKSGDEQFKKIAVAHEKPLMVITSNDGRIRYAGPAVGFLAPMMLSKLTGAGTEATGVTDTATTKQPANGQTGVASKIIDMFGKNKTTDSNKNAATNTGTRTKRVAPQPKEMDFLEKAMAEKDLREAKNLMGFGTGFTRRVVTPQKGIEKCREILKKYPNTTYSEEVRMLLRGLSRRDRKKNKVTDEEMGL